MINLFQKALKNSELKYHPYSGCEMGSDKCLGISYEGDIAECVIEIAQSAYALVGEEGYSQKFHALLEKLSGAICDDYEYGMKIIVYFPNIAWDELNLESRED